MKEYGNSKKPDTRFNQFEKANTSKTSDTFILIFLIYLVGSETARFALQRIFDNWYEPPVKYVLILMNIIAGLTVILLGISIKNESNKALGIALAIIYALYILYSNIEWAFGGL